MKLSGTNLEDAKIHNRRVVLEAIRLHGKLTRVEIARLTNLTAQTVTNITRELEQMGWLNTHAPIKAGRGQPAIPLSINPDGARSVGIYLGQYSLELTVVDLAGHEIIRKNIQLETREPSFILDKVKFELQTLSQQSETQWNKVLGIGWAMPGPFNVSGITSIGPTTVHGWENINLTNELGSVFHLPVMVANDATAAALGERLYGSAQKLSSFVYLFISQGLGAGLYLNGKIYDGTAHNAGEIGHMIVQPKGRVCFCGNHGCLERYLSLHAAYEQVGLAADANPDQLLDVLPESLDRWLQEAIPATRQAINIVECLFDADAIILGGLIPGSILEKLVERLPPFHRSVRSHLPNDMRIRVGLTGLDSVVLGAAALPIMLGDTHNQTRGS